MNSAHGSKLVRGAVWALALSGLVACKTEKGSGTVKTEQRTLGEFTEIVVGKGIQVDLELGPRAPVEVKGDDNLLPHVKTTVSGKKLEVTLEGNLQPTAPLHVHVVNPALTSVEASSGASVHVTGMAGDAIELEAASGASIEVKGAVNKLEVSGSDGAKIDAQALAAQSASIKAASGADITVTAAVSADGSASSGGRVHVKGHPEKKTVAESSGGHVDYD